MNRLKQFLTRYQVAIFVLLAYLLSWATVIPAQGGLIPHGPMIAAFIILAVVAGRPGVAGLWRQMTRWRVGWKWYLVAPGILIAANLVALAIYLARGAQIVSTAHLQPAAYLGAAIPLVFFGGQWEEPGWTGYLLRRLDERFPASPLAAALGTGVVRMAWHLPLLAYGKIPWYDFLFYSLALQILLTWLYHRTGGSVWIVMICHLFSNLLYIAMAPLFSPAQAQQYYAILVLVISAVALGLLIATRGRLGRPAVSEPAPALSAGLSG